MKHLDKSVVIETARKQALLNQPDPTLKGGLRVPLADGDEIGYTAADWQANRVGGKYTLPVLIGKRSIVHNLKPT